MQASKSTTFALLHTLTSQSYVVEVPPGPRYRLGHAVIRLADSLTQSLGLTDICRPVMANLTAKTGWTTRVATFDDGYPIFVDRIDGPGTIRFHTPLGRRELPHHSAAGKAMLSTLPDQRIRAIAAETGLPVRTPHTITTVDDLLADVALSGGLTVGGALLGVSPAWVRLFVATGQGMPGVATDYFGHTVGMCSH